MSSGSGKLDTFQAAVELPKYMRGRFTEIQVKHRESLVDFLERVALEHAPRVFAANLNFEPFYAALLELDFQHRPWAALLVASALPERSNSSVFRKAENIRQAASAAFNNDDNSRGRGFSAYVAGKWEIQRGRLTQGAKHLWLSYDLLSDESPIEEMNILFLALGGFQQGDMAGAQDLARIALQKAKSRPEPALRPQGFARLLLAFFAIYQGEFALAEAELALSEKAYGTLTDPLDLAEKPLVRTARGALHAFRAELAQAESCFDEALELAQHNTLAERYTAITKAVRAELTADVEPERSLADSRWAKDFWPEEAGGTWKSWAMRAGGAATRGAGDLVLSRSILEEAVEGDPSPLEASRSRLELAKTLIAISKGPGPKSETSKAASDASTVLKEAVAVFSAAGARYWLTQTYLALAEAEPLAAAQWKDRARSDAYGDRAYARLFSLDANQQLQIRLHGEPSVAIGETQVRFATSHAELLVYVLALAGEQGLDRDTVIARLWPGGDTARGAGRLRTALWQARVALGQEDWRLQRHGERLLLVLDGAYVDDRKAMAQVERMIASAGTVFAKKNIVGDPKAVRELSERKLDDEVLLVESAIAVLEAPLLATWTDDDWLRQLNEERQELVSHARTRLRQVNKTLGRVG